MKLVPTRRFKKAYQSLEADDQGRVERALVLFQENPRHPGLHFEKLKGSLYRTIRPDRGKLRVVLRQVEEGFELVDVDRHDRVDRNYG